MALNRLLNQMNLFEADPESGHLEDVATAVLVGALGLVALVALL